MYYKYNILNFVKIITKLEIILQYLVIFEMNYLLIKKKTLKIKFWLRMHSFPNLEK